MKFILLFCTFFPLYTLSNESTYYDVHPQNELQKSQFLENFIDRILDLVLHRLREKTVEPIALPNEIIHLGKKILFVNMTGELTVYDGLLNGLKSIERGGNTNVTVRNGTIHVSPMFFFDTLNFTYSFHLEGIGLSTEGVMYGNIKNLSVITDIIVEPRKEKVKVMQVHIISARKLSVQVASDKVVDKILNFFMQKITSIFKQAILKEVDSVVKEYIGKGIEYP